MFDRIAGFVTLNFVIIEIDQSGKIEETAKDTVIAFANGIKKSILLPKREKRKLQKFFRSIGKPRVYIYRTFAILIFLLLKNHLRSLEHVIIDREYTGREALIKEYLLRHVRTVIPSFSARIISFDEIGKKSPAHALAWDVYTKRRKADVRITAQKIIDEILG